MKGMENIDVSKITSDCRLIYDKYLNKYYLKCPMYENKKVVLNRKDIVALDPGERIFMTYYSLNDSGMIGYDIRKKILHYQTKIKQNQRRLKKKINNKSRLTKKIKKYYRKIRNIVKELHNKTALYLAKNYNKILIPKFETSKMLGKTFIKNKLKEIKIKDEKTKKQEIRNLTKKVQLTKKVKFVLNNLSHYKFRQHLIHKCKEYGCEVKIVGEEYTSQCCSKCGSLSNIYNDREKECPSCNLKINRDVNGSRNILIKNWNGNYKIRS
jgi:putative transposase